MLFTGGTHAVTDPAHTDTIELLDVLTSWNGCVPHGDTCRASNSDQSFSFALLDIGFQTLPCFNSSPLMRHVNCILYCFHHMVRSLEQDPVLVGTEVCEAQGPSRLQPQLPMIGGRHLRDANPLTSTGTPWLPSQLGASVPRTAA